jgi:lipopolysaccharide/colanic/teichoic acid biosynthesis glycosyltransferase
MTMAEAGGTVVWTPLSQSAEHAVENLSIGTAHASTSALPGAPGAQAEGQLQAVLHAADAGAKRLLDIVVSSLLLLLLLPLIVMVAVLIRLDSPGPAFFRCERVGHRRNRLAMLKFRKMHDRATGAALTLADDDRFTRLGMWLSRLKLDELPQLWHVLRGEMSLVGPRPESHDFVGHFDREYDLILEAKPGIVGLSQLAFAEEGRILDPADPVNHYLHQILPQKVTLDRLYASRRSVWLDLQILFWTVPAVMLRRQIAVHRATGRMNRRRR